MTIETAIAQRADQLYAFRKLRQEAAAEIDRLLAFLDQTEIDPDLEPSFGEVAPGMPDEAEPDELDPDLGSINPTISGSQANWAAGGATDVEGEHDGREEDDFGEDDGTAEEEPDREPSLGWTEANAGRDSDDQFNVDREAEGYRPGKADIAIRERLRASRIERPFMPTSGRLLVLRGGVLVDIGTYGD